MLPIEIGVTDGQMEIKNAELKLRIESWKGELVRGEG